MIKKEKVKKYIEDHIVDFQVEILKVPTNPNNKFYSGCPFHNSKSNDDFSYNLQSQRFTCFGGSCGNINYGDALQVYLLLKNNISLRDYKGVLSKDKKKLLFNDAIDSLAKWAGITDDNQHTIKTKKRENIAFEELEELPSFQELFYKRYLENKSLSSDEYKTLLSKTFRKLQPKEWDRFSDDACEHFELFTGGDSTRKFKYFNFYKIRDHKGNFVGLQGRRKKDAPKSISKAYNLPGFKKGHVLYNFNNVLKNIKDKSQSKYVVFHEGPADVIKAWEHGAKNAVALLGATLSGAQTTLIRDFIPSNYKLYMALDNDMPGFENSLKNYLKIREINPEVYLMSWSLGKDFLNDAGDSTKEQYIEAFENSIQIDPLHIENILDIIHSYKERLRGLEEDKQIPKIRKLMAYKTIRGVLDDNDYVFYEKEKLIDFVFKQIIQNEKY